MDFPTFEQLITPGLLLIVWGFTAHQIANVNREIKKVLENSHLCQLDVSNRFGKVEKDVESIKVQQLNHVQKHLSHEQAISRIHQRIDEFKSDGR